MRLTLDEKVVSLPVARSVRKEKLKQTLSLPPHFLQQEPPRTRERADDLWNTRVLTTVAQLIRTRKSRSMNKHMRKVVFHSGMEKLMTHFNQSTENIKVDFVQHNSNRGDPETTYSLKFCLLSPIPDSIRNAPSCTAEIVRSEQEGVARAQLVGTTEGQPSVLSSTEGIVTEILGENGGIQPPLPAISALPTAEVIPMAVALSVEDNNSTISCSTDGEYCLASSERSWQDCRQQPTTTTMPWTDQEAPVVATAVVCEVLEPEA